MQNERWLLPEGIEEMPPAQAERLESLQRRLRDLYRAWGYDLVLTPFIEYLDSLLTGTGSDLELQTFKVTDRMSGRLLGVRADMTPQVARIDAHIHAGSEPNRLCYMGTVLNATPQEHGGSRSPYQVGAELYGHAGIESDAEVLELMVETLRIAGLAGTLHLDLGHVAIFRSLAAQAGLDEACEAQLFEALQRKAVPEIDEMLLQWQLPGDMARMLAALAQLNGGIEVLDEAAVQLAAAAPGVHLALEQLRSIAAHAADLADVALHFDLGELRGYHYHTGLVFAAFVPERGHAIALGGRYDDIGAVFGRSRPATGFSTDLKVLLTLTPAPVRKNRGIFAPYCDDPSLRSEVRTLRAAGERVVCELPGQQGDAVSMACDRILQRAAAGWSVVAL